jgi:hypothetical protein
LDLTEMLVWLVVVLVALLGRCIKVIERLAKEKRCK